MKITQLLIVAVFAAIALCGISFGVKVGMFWINKYNQYVVVDTFEENESAQIGFVDYPWDYWMEVSMDTLNPESMIHYQITIKLEGTNERVINYEINEAIFDYEDN